METMTEREPCPNCGGTIFVIEPRPKYFVDVVLCAECGAIVDEIDRGSTDFDEQMVRY